MKNRQNLSSFLAELAVLHGSGTTCGFKRRDKVDFNSINLVRQGSKHDV